MRHHSRTGWNVGLLCKVFTWTLMDTLLAICPGVSPIRALEPGNIHTPAANPWLI